jgi:predicted membrane protein
MAKQPFLKEAGPIFAGFQIAVTLIGSIGFGAFASWITTYWFPFTRWAWGGLFDWINFPQVSAAEKDALTTLMFFLPMAATSFLFKNSNHQSEDIGELNPSLQRAMAFGIGIIILYIMAGSVFSEAIIVLEATSESQLADLASSEYVRDYFPYIATILYSIPILLRPHVFVYQIKMIPLIGRSLYYIFIRDSFHRKYILWSKRHTKTTRTISITIIIVMMFLVLFALGLPYAMNAVDLGVIIIASILLILLSLALTVLFDPDRLMKTAGVVIAIVLASVLWDVGMIIVNFVETAPMSSV